MDGEAPGETQSSTISRVMRFHELDGNYNGDRSSGSLRTLRPPAEERAQRKANVDGNERGCLRVSRSLPLAEADGQQHGREETARDDRSLGFIVGQEAKVAARRCSCGDLSGG